MLERLFKMKIHSKHKCPDCGKDYLKVVYAVLYDCDGNDIETNALECLACGYIEYPSYDLED